MGFWKGGGGEGTRLSRVAIALLQPWSIHAPPANTIHNEQISVRAAELFWQEVLQQCAVERKKHYTFLSGGRPWRGAFYDTALTAKFI
jgi:hypothetical protein